MNFKTITLSLILTLFSFYKTHAQSSPISVGFQVELPQDAQLMEKSFRVTPWIGWIDPIGAYAKVLMGYYEQSSLSDEGQERQSLRRVGLESGYILPLPSLPYVFIQGQHLLLLNNDRRGDRDWYEYGVGTGAKHLSSPGFKWYGSVEYRYFEMHPKFNATDDAWIEGHGFLVSIGMEWTFI